MGDIAPLWECEENETSTTDCVSISDNSDNKVDDIKPSGHAVNTNSSVSPDNSTYLYDTAAMSDSRVRWRQPRSGITWSTWQKQMSLDRASLTTSGSTNSNTNSTFEEVESIDLGGQHDLDLSGVMPASHQSGLTYHDLKRLNQKLDHGYQHRYNRGHFRHALEDSDATSQSTSDDSLSRHRHSETRKREKRDLILPDRDEKALPFASHVFNRKEQRRSDDSMSSGTSTHSIDQPSDAGVPSSKTLFQQILEYKKRSDSQKDLFSNSFPSSYSDQQSFGSLDAESDFSGFSSRRRSSSKLLGTPGFLSRNTSFESSSSFSSVSSPPDSYYGSYDNRSPAEDVLLNLGFCTSDSFIPERFARDWYSKIVEARQDKIQHFQQQRMHGMLQNIEAPPSRSISGHSTPSHRRLSRNASSSHRSETNRARTCRSKFKRAATVLTFHEEDNNSIQKLSQQQQSSIERGDSIDQLKYVLQRQANIFQNASTEVQLDSRRKAFATNRQSSLPVWLDTLSEEDEGKLSRTPSREKKWKAEHFKSFLKEQEQISSSESEISLSRAHSIMRSLSVEDSSVSTSNEGSDFENNVGEPTDGCNGNIGSERPPLQSVPSIIVSRLVPQSSTSMEVADIMDNASTSVQNNVYNASANEVLKVEPALHTLNIVTSDSDENKSQKSHRKRSLTTGEYDDKLCAPLLSPVPLSPVTVIELDHLDNQDSLDSGDSLGDTKELNYSEGENRSIAILQPITEEEHMLSDHSHSSSIEHDYCHNNQSSFRAPQFKELSTYIDDGRLSPLVLLNTTDITSKISTATYTHGNGNESAYVSSDEENSNNDRTFLFREATTQASDGELSPIMFYQDEDSIEVGQDYYIAIDRGTQCNLNNIGNDKISLKMDNPVDKCDEGTQTSAYFACQWSCSTNESEAMYYCISEGCQTDTRLGVEAAHRRSSRFSSRSNSGNLSMQNICAQCHYCSKMTGMAARVTPSTTPDADSTTASDIQNLISEGGIEFSPGNKDTKIDTIELSPKSRETPKTTTYSFGLTSNVSDSPEVNKNLPEADFPYANSTVLNRTIERLSKKTIRRKTKTNYILDAVIGKTSPDATSRLFSPDYLEDDIISNVNRDMPDTQGHARDSIGSYHSLVEILNDLASVNGNDDNVFTDEPNENSIQPNRRPDTLPLAGGYGRTNSNESVSAYTKNVGFHKRLSKHRMSEPGVSTNCSSPVTPQARRSSLKRQAPLEIFSHTNSCVDLLANDHTGISKVSQTGWWYPAESKSKSKSNESRHQVKSAPSIEARYPGHLTEARAVAETDQHRFQTSTSSQEKDALASSVATNLFDFAGSDKELSEHDKARILQDIQLDYAVDQTMDGD